MSEPAQKGSGAGSRHTGASAVPQRPVSGLFAIAKPSGPTSMHILDTLKPLLASSPLFYEEREWNSDGRQQGKKMRRSKPWEKALLQRCGRMPPKLGQGGTLDPLAEGVLVVGVGAGTKQLQQFLHCTKEYRTVGLLGSATTSYDCNEQVMRWAPYAHVSRDQMERLLPRFTGQLQQVPPLYSAVRIDGKRLFEYAREGIPLPRPIEARPVTVHELRLVNWQQGGKHPYKAPTDEVSDEEKALVGKVKELAGRANDALDTSVPSTSGEKSQPSQGAAESSEPLGEAADKSAAATASDEAGPAAFTLEMTVSSGTYVRTLVHDLGTACGSAAHVVRLIRTRQGEFSLGHEPEAEGDGVAVPGNCIPWAVFEQGLAELELARRGGEAGAGATDTRDASGLREWERALLKHIQPVS